VQGIVLTVTIHKMDVD